MATKVRSVRIMGGQWRGRRLDVRRDLAIRPTGSRIKETVFNWLTPVLTESVVLDLFAGTGALGLEALSRGAAAVSFVENQPSVVVRLKAVCVALDAKPINVYQAEATRWLETIKPIPFDIVFLDPPFDSSLLSRSCTLLEQRGWLSSRAWIYLEQPKSADMVVLPRNWRIHRDKTAGLVRYYLAERNR